MQATMQDQDSIQTVLTNTHALNPQSASLKSTWLDTTLGSMLIIADEKALHLLEFVERRGLEREIMRFGVSITSGETRISRQIKAELKKYFSGKLQRFETPLQLHGTPFQKKVWRALQKIPCGTTQSYLELAKAIDQPTACRAVAQANGANQIAIVIPCHRVINANGQLGGYGGGVSRKQWLLDHER